MITKIVPIGNSKGIRIPNHIIKLLHIDNQIDMIVDENKEEIILRPIRKTREGWSEQFREMNKNNDDQLLINDNIDLHEDDWIW